METRRDPTRDLERGERIAKRRVQTLPLGSFMLSLLLPVVASTNVSLAILIRHSDARSTSYETCAGEWINGACWMTDTMQTVVAASLTAVTDFNARDAGALPAFGNLAGCDKQLRFRLLDSGGTVAKSVRALGDLTSGEWGTDVVIGPGRSTVSTTTAAITGALDIPQTDLVLVDFDRS